jgi:hypothetical protein
MAKGGERYPVVSMGNFGWDGDQWIKIVASASGLAVNVRSWGFPEVILTGRDITTDIQSLSDPAVIGVLRTMGDAGAVPTNTSGRTFLQWFNDILRAIDDPGVGPTAAATTKTVRRLLEDILAASGGGVNETHETIAVTAPAGGGNSPDQIFSANIETMLVLCETDDAEIQTRKTDGISWNPGWIPLKKNSLQGVPVAASAYRVRNRGGVVLVSPPTVTVTGYKD